LLTILKAESLAAVGTAADSGSVPIICTALNVIFYVNPSMKRSFAIRQGTYLYFGGNKI
jgi:hypothetical protein